MGTLTALLARRHPQVESLTANTFLKHHEERLPNGMLDGLAQHLSIYNTPRMCRSALAPTELVEQYLSKVQGNATPIKHDVHMLSTIASWRHMSTIINRSTPNTPESPSTWLDPGLADRLPPGTTYINLPLTLMGKEHAGVFITPDATSSGERKLTLVLLNSTPVTLSLQLGITIAEAAAAAIMNRDVPHLRIQRKKAVLSTQQLIGVITHELHQFAAQAEDQHQRINIRERAVSISQFIDHVTTSEKLMPLRHAIHAMREGATRLGDTWPSNVHTPTHILQRAFANPRDEHKLQLAHLITSVDAINNGGQVNIAHEPLDQLPNQLTSMHLLPAELAKNMKLQSMYICAPDSHGTINNGFIVRPDVTEEGEYSFMLTFHTRSRPSVRVPLNIRVEEAIMNVTQQFATMHSTDIPCTPDMLRPYLFGVMTALRVFNTHKHQPVLRNHEAKRKPAKELERSM